MNTTDLKHFETLFSAMKEQLLTKAALAEDELLTLNSGDIIDQSLTERDAQLQLKLKGRDRFFLKKIDHALEKIESGTFGECEECGDDISTSRLMARPIATQCIHCKEEQERTEGQVLYQKRSKTLGKAINNGDQTASFNIDNGQLGADAQVINLGQFTDKLANDSLTS